MVNLKQTLAGAGIKCHDFITWEEAGSSGIQGIFSSIVSSWLSWLHNTQGLSHKTQKIKHKSNEFEGVWGWSNGSTIKSTF